MEGVTGRVLGGDGGRSRCCKEGYRTAVEDITSMHVAHNYRMSVTMCKVAGRQRGVCHSGGHGHNLNPVKPESCRSCLCCCHHGNDQGLTMVATKKHGRVQAKFSHGQGLEAGDMVTTDMTAIKYIGAQGEHGNAEQLTRRQRCGMVRQ